MNTCQHLRQYRAWRDWRRNDQRARSLAVDKEPIKNRLKITKGSDVHLEQEAILAGDPMAFAHLGAVLSKLDDATHLAGGRTQPHPSRDRKTKGRRVDVESDAADRAELLQPADPLSYRWCRHAKITSERGRRAQWIGGEPLKQPPRKLIEFRRLFSQRSHGRFSFLHRTR